MTSSTALKTYGFTISGDLMMIIKKMPVFEIVRLDLQDGYRIAVIYVDKDTDFVLKQKI